MMIDIWHWKSRYFRYVASFKCAAPSLVDLCLGFFKRVLYLFDVPCWIQFTWWYSKRMSEWMIDIWHWKSRYFRYIASFKCAAPSHVDLCLGFFGRVSYLFDVPYWIQITWWLSKRMSEMMIDIWHWKSSYFRYIASFKCAAPWLIDRCLGFFGRVLYLFDVPCWIQITWW